MKNVIAMLDSGYFAISAEQYVRPYTSPSVPFRIKGDCRGCNQKAPIGELDNAQRLCRACREQSK